MLFLLAGAVRFAVNRLNMSQTNVGILHPGAMGSSVAASARASGCEVRWASRGRSGETRDRAEKAGLIDGGDLAALAAALLEAD